jgi:NADH pyrophosphatase NudC (nudix superfamily)
MTKKELKKEVQEIMLATNGSNGDYVVALCQISQAISELDEPKECEMIYKDEYYGDDFAKCSQCGMLYVGKVSAYYDFCPECGSKIKRGEE